MTYGSSNNTSTTISAPYWKSQNYPQKWLKLPGFFVEGGLKIIILLTKTPMDINTKPNEAMQSINGYNIAGSIAGLSVKVIEAG